MKLHRYDDHQRLHIVTKDIISLSISVLLLFRHYISHKITFGAPAVAGYYAVLAVLLFMIFCCLQIFFNITFFKIFVQELHQSFKQLRFRSGPTLCRV